LTSKLKYLQKTRYKFSEHRSWSPVYTYWIVL